MTSPLARMQALGRALMLPIAVLPIAGLLLRLGQPDLLDSTMVAAAGDAVFRNLGLLFAVGVAVGLARENHGAAGLAALVCYLVATKGAEAVLVAPDAVVAGLAGRSRDLAVLAFRQDEIAKLSVPVGLASGIAAGLLYNRYSGINLPGALSFFGGRRFIAIAAGLVGIAIAGVLSVAWPSLERGLDGFSHAILGAGSVGLFVYGVLNRVLIVTGLHHILNNFAWFIVGDYHGATGDLKRFFAGDPTAGAFMSGFFPVMMFGLPGACLAMYRAASPERRAAVAGLLGSLALTSFLTGVTEPVEFTFMFLAPLLYVVHAVATGVAMALMDALGIRLGFSFSAGLFDYVLNFRYAQRPLLLLPVGAAYFALYYTLFRVCIRRFDLATPGRERDTGVAATPVAAATAGSARGEAYVAALGGAANLRSVDACTTRLRLEVAEAGNVDEPRLRALGARGIVRISASALQVVVGPVADQIAGEMRAALRERGTAPDAGGLSAALGGARNVLACEAVAGRLLLRVRDAALVDDAGLARLGVRGVARPSAGVVHVLVTGSAEAVAAGLVTAGAD
ncbi:MAG: PTS transporter subunit EIIC [Proteobacteria bacterium]|nr:PTS transporter subunit EIIC [Pseudomonadota bacterium]